MKVLYLGKTIVNQIYNDVVYEAVSMDFKNFIIKDNSGHKNVYPKTAFKEIHVLYKAKYIGETDITDLVVGNIYDITSDMDDDFYEIIDETSETYMYPKEFFEVIPNNVNVFEKAEK